MNPDTALASLICERNDHPDAPACDGCYAMAAHLRENGYALSDTREPDSLDVERLARAWLNAMTEGEHNEWCLDQADAGMDCPVAAEVTEFVPKVAAEYERLR